MIVNTLSTTEVLMLVIMIIWSVTETAKHLMEHLLEKEKLKINKELELEKFRTEAFLKQRNNTKKYTFAEINAEFKCHNYEIQEKNEKEISEMIKQELSFELGHQICKALQLSVNKHEGTDTNDGLVKYSTKIHILLKD